MKKVLNIILSLCFSILIITGIINFTVSFKQIYYYDIDNLNISQLSGLSKQEIKLNYNYLIEYNTKQEKSDFKMPTIKSSKQGIIHFEEVKEIFNIINNTFKICLIIMIIGFILNIKEKNIQYLKYTSQFLILIPVILAIPIIIDFDKSFVFFHKLLFDNDYWIFDSSLDPVINILPKEFFFHMGIFILILILISSIFIYRIYALIKAKREQ